MHSFSVLIADDDAVIRMDLRGLLEDLGHTVVGEADNGDDACRLARSLRPSVALLDVRMPRMNGLEAAAAISRERLCPVVMLTAYSEAPFIDEASQAGVLAYLVKPVRKEEIGPALEIAQARFRELVAMEHERTELHERIETDDVVRRARGLLMRRHAISEREADRRMQAQAVTRGVPLKKIAEALLIADTIESPLR
ncbi:MAG: response regulator [Chthonomonadales bacterium]|nr:response regulator [Chthonomonadales bacterium]